MWAAIKRFFSRKATPPPSPPPSPPPPTMLDLPWRKTEEWDSQFRIALCDEVKAFRPPSPNVKLSKITLLGPVNAGKSSLVNTLGSVMKGRVVTGKAAAGSEDKSLTRQYREHEMKTGTNQVLNFLMCDTKGFEEEFGLVDVEFKYILDGHMPNLYKFGDTVPLSPNHKDYRQNPTLADKSHCVCFVFDASIVTSLSSHMMSKFKNLVAIMHEKGIPHVVLLTKIDMVDLELKYDLSKAYRSIKLKRIVDVVSVLLGIPRNLIMPMQNYESEHMLDRNIDILALLSLRQMLHASEDFLNNTIS